MSTASVMDEKQKPSSPSSQFRSSEDVPWQSSRHPSTVPYRDRTLRRLLIALCIVFATWTFTRSLLPYLTTCKHIDHQSRTGDHPAQIGNGNTTRRVSLEAHIMSKCPDAKACLQELVVPTMEKTNDKVDFELSFIGTIDPGSDAVACKHGPPECLGNMILLCAAQLYPDPKSSLGFANCMINDYHDIPQRDLVEWCAMEHGLDFKKINGCISEEGTAQGLLYDSVERSLKAKVNTSCTLRLQEKVWCVTDGKKDCNDGANRDGLVRDIETAYKTLNA